MSQPGCSPTVRKETFHTVSLVMPHVEPGMSVLDVGCGEGWVAEELVCRGVGDIALVDVVDVRRAPALPFTLYDGVHLPFPDARFDIAMLNFVLHHVPDERKVALLREALRVARRTVFILEDTPVTSLDRFVSRRHGEAYRRKIASDAPFGFLTRSEWTWLFRGMGIQAESWSLGRFCRSVLQPFARAAFVLRKGVPGGGGVHFSPRAGDESSPADLAAGRARRARHPPRTRPRRARSDLSAWKPLQVPIGVRTTVECCSTDCSPVRATDRQPLCPRTILTAFIAKPLPTNGDRTSDAIRRTD